MKNYPDQNVNAAAFKKHQTFIHRCVVTKLKTVACSLTHGQTTEQHILNHDRSIEVIYLLIQLQTSPSACIQPLSGKTTNSPPGTPTSQDKRQEDIFVQARKQDLFCLAVGQLHLLLVNIECPGMWASVCIAVQVLHKLGVGLLIPWLASLGMTKKIEPIIRLRKITTALNLYDSSTI